MALKSEEIEVINIIDSDQLPVIEKLENTLSKKGFKIDIEYSQGEIIISISHKWIFPLSIILFKANIIDDIIKPLGYKIKRILSKVGSKKIVLSKK